MVLLKEKKIPMRQCVGCRESKEKKQLIRIVKNDQEITIDRTGKKMDVVHIFVTTWNVW